MQTLDTELLAEQKKTSVTPAIKITLTHGITEYVLETDRIKSLKHYFDPDHVYAKEVEFDNSDGYFTDLDLKGYTAVVSHGLLTKSGKKYAATSPMTVTWQPFNSSPGRLTCLLTMLGIPDMMELDEASADYIPAESDTKSVKTLLTEIAGATLACFSHCQAYVIVFDSEDSPMGYCPKDSFRIYTGGTRWAAFKRLIERTGCAWKFPSDGKIHVFVPVTSGETFDYEYSLDSGHPFLSKAKRETVVIPNYIVVQSQKDDDPFYSGYAKDQESIDALKTDTFNGEKRAYYTTRLQAGEADTIAAAILKRYQLNSEMGSAEVPIVNCGAELFDFIKVTDKREDDYRTGNIGSISISYNPAKQDYSMRFSLGDPPINQYIKELYSSLKSQSSMKDLDLERLHVKDAHIENLSIDNIDAIWIDPEGNIDSSKLTSDFLDNIPMGETYGLVKSMHLDASGLYFESDTIYTVRLSGEAASKVWKGTTPQTTPAVKDLWLDTNYTPNKVKRWSGSAWQELQADEIADLEKGIFTREVKSSSLTVDGLVLLDQLDTSGSYGLTLKTQLSAGKLLLSSACTFATGYDPSGKEIAIHRDTTAPSDTAKLWWDTTLNEMKQWNGSAWVAFTGEWYRQSGVALDATKGIRLYGGQMALITYPSLVDYLNDTNRQCYIGTDGKIYAGAGAVALDVGGILIKGAKLTLQDSAGTYSGIIYIDSTGYLRLDAWSRTRIDALWVLWVSSSLVPSSHNSLDLGASTKRWKNVYAQIFRPESSTSGGIILPSTAIEEEGSVKIIAGEAGIYVYRGTTWQHIT